MTSFNYLRPSGPSLYVTVALYGALIAALSAFVAEAGWETRTIPSRAGIGIQRQFPARAQHHPSFRIVRLPGGQSGFARRATKPVPLRLSQRLPRLKAVLPTLQPGLTPTPSATDAVPRVKPRVRISVLGIATGSRSSALVLLGGKTQVVAVGDLVGGERVTDIRDGGIALSNHQMLSLGDANR